MKTYVYLLVVALLVTTGCYLYGLAQSQAINHDRMVEIVCDLRPDLCIIN